ncbi:acyl carrier protein [Streptomyces spectabilis]|uniref:Acyl carrier protein n=1 Tax=Streptomyces spectabilis TaxID=68270 RepID=A0A516R2L9_STRST|nr:acyl carrier protein [Streptomyces spectabilis]QDQ09906.1 acyl carrier protein [Streptomyces spectabilis]
MDTSNGTEAVDAAAVAEELRTYLTGALGREPGPDEDYFALGLVTSLFAIELVNFVEQRYGIEVTVDDLDLDHFRTLGRLRDFVLAKTAGRGAAA